MRIRHMPMLVHAAGMQARMRLDPAVHAVLFHISSHALNLHRPSPEDERQDQRTHHEGGASLVQAMIFHR